MFDITYSDHEIFETYLNAGKARKGGTYDFTFENRYLIYHADLCRKVDYMAIDMTTERASRVITVNPDRLYTKANYKTLVPHVLDSVKYTGDTRYLNRFAADPVGVIDYIFRTLLPDHGYSIREGQIALAKKLYKKRFNLSQTEIRKGNVLPYLVASIAAKYHSGRISGRTLAVTVDASNNASLKALAERTLSDLSAILFDAYIIERPLTAHFIVKLPPVEELPENETIKEIA